MNIRLLVSVRNAREAVAAVEAGADIIDVKEPAHGSLGFAGIETVRAVLAAVAGRVPVSAALGEVRDWFSESVGRDDANEVREVTGIQNLSASFPLEFVKVGLAGATPNWTSDWLTVRRMTQHNDASPSTISAEDPESLRTVPEWVAVAYADHKAAGSPSLQDVLSAAVETECRALLIDTWSKTSGCTFDLIATEELADMATMCRRAGLEFALAGQLNITHLDRIREVRPSILAVRGAVCREGLRTAEICSDRIRDLRAALNAEFPENEFPVYDEGAALNNGKRSQS